VEIVSGTTALRDWRHGVSQPAVATIGAFDGVHLGHRAVIAEVDRLAARVGAGAARRPRVVVTFDRHPASVVRPESAPRLLTDLDQKLELLAATGVIDATVVIPFDEHRAAQPAGEFVEDVLVDGVNAGVVVVGSDFHFGHRRRGNTALLRSIGAERGFTVVALDLVGHEGPVGAALVSSTEIRRRLATGDVEGAAALLGRLHEVRGVVEAGDGRGRGLGFPTANVNVDPGVEMPAAGIYAGWYRRPDGVSHPAAMSIGWRPTFPDAGSGTAGMAGVEMPVLEAHLLDFDAGLYGEKCAVSFLARLRDEERFESVEDLVAQMGADVESARRILGTAVVDGPNPSGGGPDLPCPSRL